MIYPYVVTLKNRQTRLLDAIGLLLALLSTACFLWELLRSTSTSLAYLLGAIAVPAIVVWNLYRSLAEHKKVYYSRALLIAALVWMKMPYWEAASLFLIILAILEYQAKYSVEIGFSDNQIVINTLFKKRYAWSDFESILIKDGLLTLDFTSNRILQWELEEEEDQDADEEEFNAWCKTQLSKNQPT